MLRCTHMEQSRPAVCKQQNMGYEILAARTRLLNLFFKENKTFINTLFFSVFFFFLQHPTCWFNCTGPKLFLSLFLENSWTALITLTKCWCPQHAGCKSPYFPYKEKIFQYRGGVFPTFPPHAFHFSLIQVACAPPGVGLPGLWGLVCQTGVRLLTWHSFTRRFSHFAE